MARPKESLIIILQLKPSAIFFGCNTDAILSGCGKIVIVAIIAVDGRCGSLAVGELGTRATVYSIPVPLPPPPRARTTHWPTTPC